MINRIAIVITSLGLVSGMVTGESVAQMPHQDKIQSSQSQPTEQFRRIEQPIGNKIAVTLGGLGLIGLELWWFLASKSKSAKATAREDV